MNLFEIAKAIEDKIRDIVDEETGEIIGTELDFEALDKLEMEQNCKRKYLAQLYKNTQADALAYKSLKMEYARKQKSAEGLAESLLKYLDKDLAGQKWEADDKTVRVNYRAVNNKVKVTDIDKVPREFFAQKFTEDTLSKTRVKEALLAGETVDGCHLEDTKSISIK